MQRTREEATTSGRGVDKQAIHLLLIEDNPGDMRLIEHMLDDKACQSFELIWADSLAAGVDCLDTRQVDVILLDLGLPESNGLETLERLYRQVPRPPALVVLSGLADERIALQAVQAGAQDYLVKGQVDSPLLARSVRYALERSQTEEALREARADLERRVEERTAELARAVEALHEEIAERKRAEAALREREVRIRRLVESNIIGVFFWEVDGCVLDANEAFLRMTGYARTDLGDGGLKWGDLTPPEYAALDALAVDELLKSGTCTPYEKDYIRKDGARIPILLGGALLEGSRRSGVAFVLDMSASKQAATDRQAREFAEARSRAKSDFLANMSHELRSPLNTMLGFTRLMARHQDLPAEVREDMRIVLRSGEYLHTLINQVLDLSKIEAGRMALVETGFDLDRLLDELRDMFSIRARDKNLAFSINRAATVPPYLQADLLKLRQVLTNLLNNAFKFTERGEVALGIEVQALASDRCRLLFSVRDTGAGIAAHERELLFGAFSQTSTGRSAKEGSGLGLAISRSFVRLMGGEIGLASTPGRGTTVRFDIPVRIIDAGALAPCADSTAHTVVALLPGQPRYRILLADDRREARQLLLRLLQPLGFELREAATGLEALEVWQAWQPHLIWMDMRMPVMSGREAARRIKQLPQGKDTVIIALTASSFEEERASILADGCDDFLSKPFDEASLFGLMHKHLGVRFAFRENQDSAPPPRPPPDMRALAALPAALAEPLQQALLHLDTAAVERAIGAVRTRDAVLADALQELADEFQYDRILQLLPSASVSDAASDAGERR